MTTLALESGYWGNIGHGIGAIVLYAIVGLALMLIGFYAIDITTPGPLRKMVAAGNPNAVVVTASGMVSMALIVVLAVYSSSGKLSEGIIAAAIYGLLGIVVQVVSVRVLEWVLGIDIGDLLHAESYSVQSLVVAAAHLGLGLVVAVAIS
ncbi:hypothetical protein BJY24_000508 [Nocardia transvalensis]|uniref:DUF350 domain-containing protein n=1 Tax=Nocardia transvalensis TaxID=37333 RepID=A0A7W9UG30_9NOCA|nr:DUF350 domain-containing protein [Nocardia transvalensis]MBB5911641.1 hypothetical protein [Nocardia transvalensis]